MDAVRVRKALIVRNKNGRTYLSSNGLDSPSKLKKKNFTRTHAPESEQVTMCIYVSSKQANHEDRQIITRTSISRNHEDRKIVNI